MAADAPTGSRSPATTAADAAPRPGAAAAASGSGEASAALATPPIPVSFRGTRLFDVRGPIGTLSTTERAAAIETRLMLAAGQRGAGPPAVRAQRRTGVIEIFAGEQFVMSVTPADAAPLGRTAEQRAADLVQVISGALEREFVERSTAGLVRAALLSVLGCLAAWATWLAIHFALRWLEGLWRRRVAPAVPGETGSALRMFSEQLGDVLAALARGARVLSGLVLVVFAVGYALSLFPWTRDVAATLDTEIRATVRGGLRAIVEYLPNLFYIAVLALVFRVLVRFARLFFERVASGQLRIEGFHAEWGAPTFQIVRVLLVAFAIAVIFPYMPASDSRAFQGVTVLLGVVVSFGSASAVANLIGGLVLTYMRALAVGDRVRIGDAEGDIVGRDAFVVRMRTVKNVEITIPNATVLSGPIVNFSPATRESGVLLYTRVTIGYDVPWRQVHELLFEAARRTPRVLAEPAPFVLQTALDDSYVHYELNVHIREASLMSRILSDLHANVQDVFAAAGVEIMSPVYEAHRDGGGSTVPRAGARTVG
jgi:small-conductance mechanosensitive channel